MKLSQSLMRLYMANQSGHLAFRTVMVENNNVEEAVRILNGIMLREGLTQRWKHTRRYEKPTEMRRRVSYERCVAIYAEDMRNRIALIMKKNRTEPYPGTK